MDPCFGMKVIRKCMAIDIELKFDMDKWRTLILMFHMIWRLYVYFGAKVTIFITLDIVVINSIVLLNANYKPPM